MFFFTKISEKQLNNLTKSVKDHIISKLIFIKYNKISADIRPIKNSKIITHRLRIGDYRLLLRKRQEGYDVLKIGHRRDIYK